MPACTLQSTVHGLGVQEDCLPGCWASLTVWHLAQTRYEGETFVHILPEGQIPHTRHVRGSNYAFIGVFEDRLPGRAIVISGADPPCQLSAWERLHAGPVASDRLVLWHLTGLEVSLSCTMLPPGQTAVWLKHMCAVIDNLVKGASGQAIQNLNLLMGLPEETGLLQGAMFP